MNKENKVLNATKWSSLTEIAAKLVTPISNMILARLLTPDAFGVVATATMIFSFADMFTDSGFQKYLVQHEFANAQDREESTTVAFWTNLGLSLLFWIIIALFSEQIAVLVGNPGLGNVIVVACISLPLTSFSSIQMALFRRDFDFKTLFYVRMVAVVIPLVVTVPLAFITHSYWSIIIGTICGNLSNAIILTWRSSWKPKLFYSITKLKEMLWFSVWSLIEAVSIWLTNYIGVFIVGAYLSSYYLGLYKTSMNTVNQIMNLITSATTTVLFSALSREQNDRDSFQNTFFMFQRNVGLLIVPMGIGIFLYQNLITKILLGSQWMEAAGFIGLWGLVNSLKILLSNYCSEAYRATGKPKVSVLVQVSQLIVLIPAIIYGAKQGFETLYLLRCMVSVELIVVNLFTVKIALKISPIRMVQNIAPEIFAALIMAVVALGLKQISDSIIWEIVSIAICACVYFAVILLLPCTRKSFLPIIRKYLKK
ncbi:MAG: lipopolysaccharide biosynthesis protein [bacterium]|nr:lipopolysaccharide biosynthesis protein [bacterium]